MSGFYPRVDGPYIVVYNRTLKCYSIVKKTSISPNVTRPHRIGISHRGDAINQCRALNFK